MYLSIHNSWGWLVAMYLSIHNSWGWLVAMYLSLTHGRHPLVLSVVMNREGVCYSDVTNSLIITCLMLQFSVNIRFPVFKFVRVSTLHKTQCYV